MKLNLGWFRLVEAKEIAYIIDPKIYFRNLQIYFYEKW